MTCDPSKPVDVEKELRINEVRDGLSEGNLAPATRYLWAHLRGEHPLDRQIIVDLPLVLDPLARNEDWQLKVTGKRRRRGAPSRDEVGAARSARVLKDYNPSMPIDEVKALRIKKVLDGLNEGKTAAAAHYLRAHLRGEYPFDPEIIRALARVLDGSAMNEDWRLKAQLVHRRRGAASCDVWADVRSAFVSLAAENMVAEHSFGARKRVMKKNVLADITERHGAGLRAGKSTIRRALSKKGSGSSR